MTTYELKLLAVISEHRNAGATYRFNNPVFGRKERLHSESAEPPIAFLVGRRRLGQKSFAAPLATLRGLVESCFLGAVARDSSWHTAKQSVAS